MLLVVVLVLAGGGCPCNSLLASAEFVVPDNDDHDISVTRSSAAHAHAQLSNVSTGITTSDLILW